MLSDEDLRQQLVNGNVYPQIFLFRLLGSMSGTQFYKVGSVAPFSIMAVAMSVRLLSPTVQASYVTTQGSSTEQQQHRTAPREQLQRVYCQAIPSPKSAIKAFCFTSARTQSCNQLV